MKRVMNKNQDKAEQVRTLLRERRTKMYNFISSPGAGKTALPERTLAHMNYHIRIGIIEGDVSTSCSKNTGLERWYEWLGKEDKK